ncbi:MAG: pectate lyase [Synechococcaceae cyanobacterium]|nr:pectate lyase [Synechococcaceae cyanobacterium]
MSPEPHPRRIRTPWGDLLPKVDLSPVLYLLVLYGIVYFLPFEIFEFWSKGEDGPAEWIQFLAYAGASLFAFTVAWRRRRSFPSLRFLGWLALAIFCFLMAGEEISWGERITGLGIDALREINAQEETTIHNIPVVQNYMHFGFILFGLLFGYLGWRFLPAIDALPARWFSLYFLPVALFYTYFDLSWITHGERIRNDQEAIEILMAVGLFLHARAAALRRPPFTPEPSPPELPAFPGSPPPP